MSLNVQRTFKTGTGSEGKFHSLPELEKQGVGPVSKLPISIRIVLESLVRNLDGKKVTEADVKNLANWNAKKPGDYEIPFTVARIVLQDFTGVPLLVDLAAMRSAVADPAQDHRLHHPRPRRGRAHRQPHRDPQGWPLDSGRHAERDPAFAGG
jgi:aconitate hydratase